MKRFSWQPWLAMLVLVLLALACGPFSTTRTGALNSSSVGYTADDAEQLEADITLGAGDLTIDGGNTALVFAEFTYNIEAWEPETETDTNGTVARFTARQPEYEGIPIGDEIINRWDIHFNDTIPLDLAIDLGAGESTMALQGVNLEKFRLNAGAGDVNIELGSGNLTEVDISAGVGDLDLDLTGNWGTDADINIDGGVGKISLLLPKDVGVIVNLSVGVGDINASGLNVDGDSYTNDAYGSSDVTLSIDFTAGVGEIRLQVED